MDCLLKVSEEQARVLRDACEMYARMGKGQLGFIAEHPSLPRAASCIGMGLRSAEYALKASVLANEDAVPTCRAWDLYQVIRGRLAWDEAGNPPERPSMQVMYDVPMNTAGETLAEIQAVAAADIGPASVAIACGRCGGREAVSDGDVVEQDGITYRVRLTPLGHTPIALGECTYSVIILSSEDGIDWAHAVLYPKEWASEEADRRAIEAFKSSQKFDPRGWDWDDVEPELIARGFLIPPWHRGPNWDAQRVEVPEETE